MSRKFTASFAAALTLGAFSITAQAQQHRATRLGNPATRFAKPLKKADDLRVLLRSEKMKADVAAVLAEVGWAGDAADLDRGAATAEISAVDIAPGTRLTVRLFRLVVTVVVVVRVVRTETEVVHGPFPE